MSDAEVDRWLDAEGELREAVERARSIAVALEGELAVARGLIAKVVDAGFDFDPSTNTLNHPDRYAVMNPDSYGFWIGVDPAEAALLASLTEEPSE